MWEGPARCCARLPPGCCSKGARPCFLPHCWWFDGCLPDVYCLGSRGVWPSPSPWCGGQFCSGPWWLTCGAHVAPSLLLILFVSFSHSFVSFLLLVIKLLPASPRCFIICMEIHILYMYCIGIVRIAFFSVCIVSLRGTWTWWKVVFWTHSVTPLHFALIFDICCSFASSPQWALAPADVSLT